MLPCVARRAPPGTFTGAPRPTPLRSATPPPRHQARGSARRPGPERHHAPIPARLADRRLAPRPLLPHGGPRRPAPPGRRRGRRPRARQGPDPLPRRQARGRGGDRRARPAGQRAGAGGPAGPRRAGRGPGAPGPPPRVRGGRRGPPQLIESRQDALEEAPQRLAGDDHLVRVAPLLRRPPRRRRAGQPGRARASCAAWRAGPTATPSATLPPPPPYQQGTDEAYQVETFKSPPLALGHRPQGAARPALLAAPATRPPPTPPTPRRPPPPTAPPPARKARAVKRRPPPAPPCRPQAGPEEPPRQPLLVEIAPAADDGLHWIIDNALGTGGKRVPVDAALVARTGRALSKEQVIPEPAPWPTGDAPVTWTVLAQRLGGRADGDARGDR